MEYRSGKAQVHYLVEKRFGRQASMGRAMASDEVKTGNRSLPLVLKCTCGV